MSEVLDTPVLSSVARDRGDYLASHRFWQMDDLGSRHK